MSKEFAMGKRESLFYQAANRENLGKRAAGIQLFKTAAIQQ